MYSLIEKRRAKNAKEKNSSFASLSIIAAYVSTFKHSRGIRDNSIQIKWFY
ncbi:protein of unknown function [Brochothrix thermosphacta]|nr:protein of unknown function [Brochothrix thermosphacta]